MVALHDVAPPFEREIRAQLALLNEMGVDRCALLVVPNWHGAYPLSRDMPLATLLRRQVERGSEVVLHGLQHRRRGAIHGPAHLRLRAELVAPNVCEFLSLAAEEVIDGVRIGVRLFEDLGLPRPTTFCAPGWLLSPDLYEPLAEAGIRRVAAMFSVQNLEHSRRTLLPSLGYMGGGPLHEAAIGAGNEIISAILPRLNAAQLYLHPQGGLDNRAARRVMEHLASLVQAGWGPTTYEALTPPS